MSSQNLSAESQDDEARAIDEERVQQTNKRLTLNLLIQGAAAHTFLTAHHLVAEELEAIHPGLVELYDKMVVAFHLNYFIGDICVLYGSPRAFWRRTTRPDHPFYRHPLLARYGGELTRASKRYLIERGLKKGNISLPVLHYAQLVRTHLKMARTEYGHEIELTAAAKRATAMIWNIDESRLDAELTHHVAFGHLREPKTEVGRITRAAVVGYGGVQHDGRRFQVVGKAICLPLLMHELTKGTAELICLHGLNSLDDEMYEAVVSEADQLEYETWLLQAGAEAWRRMLAAIPTGWSVSEVLMRLALLDPQPLEQIMLAIANDPAAAKPALRRLLDR